MKTKGMILALCLCAMLALLCACSGAANTEPEKAQTPGPETAAPAESNDEPAAKSLSDSDGYDLALSLIGEEVSALYDAIGEPNDTDYAPSCMGKGDDGELHYDGFTVYTYREGESEVIQDVLN